MLRLDCIFRLLLLFLAVTPSFLGCHGSGGKEAQAASLVIDTDTDCTVSVNGENFALKAGETRTVRAETGDNVVRAVSSKDDSIWKQVVKVGAAEQKAVEIMLRSGKVGEAKVNSRDGLAYVWIPAGTFQMGCSPGDFCLDDERPTHAVTISKGFWMGRTPVTQAAYQRVTGTNPSHFRSDQRPVETVSWYEAVTYCSAIAMRLPTEAEWEYAARAGSTESRYGNIDAIAWYGGNSGGQTHNVAQKQPNGWQLYDMLGNVWQWTADWYNANYYSQSPSQDPPGPTSGRNGFRVLRGGCWNPTSGNIYLVRVSRRLSVEPSGRGSGSGFRCAGQALP